jgi:hypothetical protein
MPYKFSPVGRCIYCGDNKSQLTDEHIIPLGLGGTVILPAASCKPCATLTGKFEGVVQRTIFGDFRIRYNLPTRRKNERPKLKKIGTRSGLQVDIPAVEFPVTYFVYNFGTCGLLLNAPAALDVSRFTLTEIHNSDELRNLITKHNWDGVLKTTMRPDEFRKALAKIAYSWFTAVAGYGNFEPLVLDAITQKHFNMSYLVGQNEKTEPTVDGPHWHNMRLRTMHQIGGAASIFVIDLRLFQSNPTPTYHIVVGKSHSMEQYAKVMEKVRNSGHVELPHIKV